MSATPYITPESLELCKDPHGAIGYARTALNAALLSDPATDIHEVKEHVLSALAALNAASAS